MTDKRVQTGEKPHDFTLIDTQGEEITLSKFEGKKIVYLVFNRGFF